MTPLTRAESGALPKLNVYVDETGDRGWSSKASPFFAMTALLVPSEDHWTVQYAAGGLRSIIHASRPGATAPLHWVDHFRAKRPERRLRAAQSLAGMPSAKVIHVIVHKDSARTTASGLSDGVRFYNYTARLLLERVAHAAKLWEGGPRLAVVRLGAVRGMDHSDTEGYLDRVRNGWCPTYGVPWDHIKWPPVWSGTDWDGIQLADIHAGLLNAALTGSMYDEACAVNLLLCKHQLYRAPAGTLMGYGVKVIGDARFVRDRCWWPKWSVG